MKYKKLNLENLTFDKVQSYDAAKTYLLENNRPIHFLMGNGFSMSFDYDIFSYNALHRFIEGLNDKILKQVFEVINSKNFELIMTQLDNFIEMATKLSTDKVFIDKLVEANTKLKSSLIDAVSSLHPEHVYEVAQEKSKTCFEFLSTFYNSKGSVFSTNYDLLLYWVLMRNDSKISNDGFGMECLNPSDIKKGEDAIFDDLQWGKYKDEQNTFYLHGALQLFDTGVEIEKETYKNRTYLLNNIKKRLEAKEYPIFVTAGNGDEKLKHIKHNSYLNFCYDSFSSIKGSLVTFGFNFGEYDEHLIEAINKAAKRGAQDGNKLFSIYIGVYSENDFKHIQSIEHKFDCKVNVYKSETTNIWG
ncbi:DUF4917 family protein [Xanthomarina gelatinilytica]|uniref:DUF4917 family protein n=1 Tax=Xanthomarina gelatinilytica TaxID=1137281 RepID=UPI003AA88F07